MKVQVTAAIGAMVIALGVRNASGEEVKSVNVAGCFNEPIPMTSTGEVAFVSVINHGEPLRHLVSTRIPLLIRGLATDEVNGPHAVAGAGAWFLVTRGKLCEVLVDGLRFALLSQAISNGVVRTKDFGQWWVYSYNGGSPYALVGSNDQLRSLKKWLAGQKNATPAEQQGGGYSPPAARPSKPTP